MDDDSGGEHQRSPDPSVTRRRFLAGAAGAAAAAPVILVACSSDAEPQAKPAASTTTDPAARTGATSTTAPRPAGTRPDPTTLPSVVGDGVADDHAALQAIFDQLRPDEGVAGARIVLPPGVFLLGDTLELQRFSGSIEGQGVGHPPTKGGQGTVLRWAGPPGRPMIRVRDSKGVLVGRIRFEGHDERPPSAGIEFQGAAQDQQGTNAQLVVSDCHLGPWTWAEAGTDQGRLDAAIAFTGDNGNNDQFSILRCTFAGGGREGTTGVRIDNTQSVWGQLTDCLFDDLAEGLRTSASTVLDNPQFNRCGTDLVVGSTAQVQVRDGNSEQSGRIATVAPEAGLRWNGGYLQAHAEHMGPVLIDAFPSESASVVLRDVRITYPTGRGRPWREGTRPTIRFGPDRAAKVSAGGPGFVVRATDCTGLYADQFELAGELWAVVPASRGSVEVTSRHREGVVAFRNELWNDQVGFGRTRLDTAAWDPPRPGTW
ncbi:MAG: hypothetical protein R2746_12275 [Acidimicrobiales bacterium]|nr:hypothetical protein [Actinomycetota bacterium]